MAYGAMPVKVANDTITLGDYNTLKGDFEAGVPDIFTTKGDIAAATAADAAARLGIGADDSTLVPDAAQSTGLAWQIQPAVRVHTAGNVNPTPDGWRTVDFDQERFDTDGMWVIGTPSRLTVPTGGNGIYLIGACVVFAEGGSDCEFGLRIRVNGTTVAMEQSQDTGDEIYPALNLTTLSSLVATDYIEIQVYTHNNVDVISDGDYSPEFWAIWQRRA